MHSLAVSQSPCGLSSILFLGKKTEYLGSEPEYSGQNRLYYTILIFIFQLKFSNLKKIKINHQIIKNSPYGLWLAG